MAHDAAVKRMTQAIITLLGNGQNRWFNAVAKIRDPNQTYTANDLSNDVMSWWLDLADTAFAFAEGSPLAPVAFIVDRQAQYDAGHAKESVALRDPVPTGASFVPKPTDLSFLGGGTPIDAGDVGLSLDAARTTLTVKIDTSISGNTPATGMYQGFASSNGEIVAVIVAIVQ